MGDRASGPAEGPRRGRHGAGSSVLTPATGLPAVPQLDGDTPPVPAPPVVDTVVDPCTCGHAREAHEHYRRGSDCGVCGATGCGAYRALGARGRRRRST